VNSPSAFRAIHGAKANVKKSKFYEVWPRNSQDHNTLNTVDKERHAQKRRVLNLAFSEKSLRSAEAFVLQHLDRWCELLLHDTKDGIWTEPKNMAILAHQLVFDIMGDLCFGKSFDIKEPGPNPFRDIPHDFGEYLKFMYMVSRPENIIEVRNNILTNCE
jgi:cytochrome P450